MKFFCLQPDIVEDAPSVRYKTKSANNTKSNKDHHQQHQHGGITGLFLPMTTKHTVSHPNSNGNGVILGTVNRSKSSIGIAGIGPPQPLLPSATVGAGAGMRNNGQRKHSSIGGTGIGQAFAPATAPLHHHHSSQQQQQQQSYAQYPPASAPPATVYLGPSHSIGHGHGRNGGPAITNDPNAIGHHVTTAMMAGGTDSDRELSGPGALRRKSRRMSAPLVSLGLAERNHAGAESGNESSREKKARRVSKLAIGAPEGFRHEGHVGVGEAFAILQNASMVNGGMATVGSAGVGAGNGDSRPRTNDGRQTDRPPSVHDNVEAWRAEIEHTRKPSNSSVATPAARPKGPRPTSVAPPVDMKNSMRTRKRSSVDGSINRPSIDREREREQDGSNTEPPTSSRPGALLPADRVSPTTAPVAYAQRSRSRSRSGSDSFGHSTKPAIVPQQQQQQPAVLTQRHQTTAPTHLPGQDSITSLASTTFSNPTSQSSHATTATSLTRSHSEKPYYHPSSIQQQQSPLQQYYQQQQQTPRHNPQSSSYGGHESSRGGWSSHLQDVSAASLQRSASANAAIRPTLAPSSTSSTATAASIASSSATLTGPPGSMSASSRKAIPIPRRKPVPQHLPATVEVSPFPTRYDGVMAEIASALREPEAAPPT
ncbi:hypothetical protein FRC19_010556 [Serendipita sp. 401]|nr:hypothetical protein FRC19_010556 [Serendipita sp. 401]